MFVGLREVGWVGPEQEAVYGGCCSWLPVPNFFSPMTSTPAALATKNPTSCPTGHLLKVLPSAPSQPGCEPACPGPGPAQQPAGGGGSLGATR